MDRLALGMPGKRIALPTYPFQRGQYWLEREEVPRCRNRRVVLSLRDGENHPFLGRRLDSPAIAGTVFEIEMGVERPLFFDDHRIFGHLLMPSTASRNGFVWRYRDREARRIRSRRPRSHGSHHSRTAFPAEEDSFLIQLILEESTEPGMGFRVCSGKPSARTGIFGGHTSLAASHRRTRRRNRTTETWNREEVWTRCSEEI